MKEVVPKLKQINS